MAHSSGSRLSGQGIQPSGRQAVFLDRDGVIIRDRPDYVKSWNEVRFLPGALAALRRLGQSKYAIAIVTNQSAVGRGIITLDEALAINQQMVTKIRASEGRIDACFLCPHSPGDGCDCRKPNPGMLLQAAGELGLDLRRSYLIGDAVSDIEAAQATGAQGILVLTGRGDEQAPLLQARSPDSCLIVANLGSAVDYILSGNR